MLYIFISIMLDNNIKFPKGGDKMKYAYVVSERNRSVTMIDFTDKTTIDLLEFDNGDFDKGIPYTWDKANDLDFADYASVEDITSQVREEDSIIPSDLLLSEICGLLNDSQYNLWESSCDVCFKMLWAYSKLVNEISLEDLTKAMQ